MYVYIHKQSILEGRLVYIHIHTQRGVFQAPLPKSRVPGSESGQQTAMLSGHSKPRIPYAQGIPRSLPREGLCVVTHPGELQPHHHLCGVFLDEVSGLASECSKGRGVRRRTGMVKAHVG